MRYDNDPHLASLEEQFKELDSKEAEDYQKLLTFEFSENTRKNKKTLLLISTLISIVIYLNQFPLTLKAFGLNITLTRDKFLPIGLAIVIFFLINLISLAFRDLDSYKHAYSSMRYADFKISRLKSQVAYKTIIPDRDPQLFELSTREEFQSKSNMHKYYFKPSILLFFLHHLLIPITIGLALTIFIAFNIIKG